LVLFSVFLNFTELAKDWTAIGVIRKLMKDNELAKTDLELAIKIYQENNQTNTEDYGKCLFELSCIFQEENDPKTIESLQTVVNIPSLSDDLKIKCLIQLGTVCMHSGFIQRAEKNYQEAFSIIRNNQNMDKVQFGESIYSLGVLYATEKKYQLAEEFIMEAIKLFEDSEEKRLFLIPRCYMTLGTIYKESKPKKSIEMFQKALTLTPSFMGLNAGDHAFILCNIGEIYHKSGDYETSFEYLEKAMVAIKQSRTPEKHQHILGNIHLNFGCYYSKIKDYVSAETHFQDAYKEYSEFYSGFVSLLLTLKNIWHLRMQRFLFLKVSMQ
jgi:tetratricopeptide (TPR) repeat protein